jgi:hypothetical protein
VLLERVTPKVSMGFELMIEIEAGGTSSKFSQFDEDGKLAPFIGNANIAVASGACATGTTCGTAWGFALSVMRVPTGLFVQGHYNHVDYGGKIIGAPSGYWGETASTNAKPTDQWLVQFGVSKNWFGYGSTSVYGEFGEANDWGAAFTNNGATIGRNFAVPANTFGFTFVNGVTSTELRVWGMGITQNFTAAATDVYLGYRRFDADIKCVPADASGNVCAGATGGGNYQCNQDAPNREHRRDRDGRPPPVLNPAPNLRNQAMSKLCKIAAGSIIATTATLGAEACFNPIPALVPGVPLTASCTGRVRCPSAR